MNAIPLPAGARPEHAPRTAPAAKPQHPAATVEGHPQAAALRALPANQRHLGPAEAQPGPPALVAGADHRSAPGALAPGALPALREAPQPAAAVVHRDRHGVGLDRRAVPRAVGSVDPEAVGVAGLAPEVREVTSARPSSVRQSETPSSAPAPSPVLVTSTPYQDTPLPAPSSPAHDSTNVRERPRSLASRPGRAHCRRGPSASPELQGTASGRSTHSEQRVRADRVGARGLEPVDARRSRSAGWPRRCCG